MKEPIREAKVSDIFEMSDTYKYGSALFLKLKAISLVEHSKSAYCPKTSIGVNNENVFFNFSSHSCIYNL